MTYKVVIAPDIPPTAQKQLMAQFEAATRDRDYKVVTNYEYRVDIIEPEFGTNLMVVAPNVPAAEVPELRAAFDGAPSRYLSTKVERLIVVNFEITVFQVPLG